MKVLFCNIAFMKYYRGIIPKVDEPFSFVTKAKDSDEFDEQYNFLSCNLEGEDVCLGFVSAAAGKTAAQIHLEKLSEVDPTEETLEDVLVIWCAKKEGTDNRTVVVGWYEHAKVYRYYQEAIFGDDQEEYHQLYNVVAKADNCVLLPYGERSRYTRWNVPRKKGKTGPAFGFGNSNIWFPTEDKAESFVISMIERIHGYHEENWMDISVEELI